ncbi:MAG: hypothetical protein WAZ94_15350 [Phycisphaerales bacterium]|nr:hypothetical protein [Chloroflexota bacterium]
MAISTQDALVAALAGAQKRGFRKASATSEGAGTWRSLWALAGQPGAGAAAGSVNGAIPTSATTGAIPYTNPGGANLGYVGRLSAQGSTAGTLILYDRLWHNSALVGNVTTLQSFTQPALTRATTGDGVELWGEVYSAMGATGTVMTAIYTNQDGTGSRSASYTQPANALSVGQMVPFSLQAGDSGVRSVQSLQLSISTGTAGNFGLTLLRRLAEIPLTAAGVGGVLDFFGLGGGVLEANSCLAMMVLCSATSTGEIQAGLSIIEG